MKSYYILSTISIFIFILALIQTYYIYKKIKLLNKINKKQQQIIQQTQFIQQPQIQLTDYEKYLQNKQLIKDYDKKSNFDPFEKQFNRPENHVIGNIGTIKYFNLTTRGHPDDFHIIGILTAINETDKNNKILKLYGRQRQPNSSSTWDYYTAISSGNEMVKIDLGEKRELNDDDIINIQEMKSDYKLKKYPNDIFTYNPFIF